MTRHNRTIRRYLTALLIALGVTAAGAGVAAATGDVMPHNNPGTCLN
jgi:hypothetical protein